jgi:methylase of polypeptide subunit release factors
VIVRGNPAEVSRYATSSLVYDALLPVNLAVIKPNLQKVLDIGTGTGVWAIDFGLGSPQSVDTC